LTEQASQCVLAGPGIVGLISDFFIMANITNTGNESLRLLHHPNSLISTLPTEKFHAVRKESQKVPSFIGVRAKFVQETAAARGAYTSVSPGESVEVTHDGNCKGYRIDLDPNLLISQ